jgi:hypothetical protein
MKITTAFQSALLAAVLMSAGTSAFAEGDIYSRLAEMKAKMMQVDKAGMISKADYLSFVEKAWDMKAEEMKSKDGKLTPAQLKELEKSLGRMVSN